MLHLVSSFPAAQNLCQCQCRRFPLPRQQWKQRRWSWWYRRTAERRRGCWSEGPRAPRSPKALGLMCCPAYIRELVRRESAVFLRKARAEEEAALTSGRRCRAESCSSAEGRSLA